MPVSTKEKATSFVELHNKPGVFALPNPWDVGSARMLENIGFSAVATTSLGFAQTLGRFDGAVSLDEKIQHCRDLTRATDIPITADLENGFGDSPEAVRDCIVAAAEAGIVGGSIEDFSGDANHPIYDFDLAVERITAAAEAARSVEFPFVLTARSEQLLRCDYDLDETVKRLNAYEAAGADVLYAPALNTLEDVQLVASSVNKPLNVLGSFLPDYSVAEIGNAGAKRVSIGGALARYLTAAMQEVARALHEEGDLEWCNKMASVTDMKRLLG